MTNKETLQNNNNRLNANNNTLNSILETINNLPEAGGSGENISVNSEDDLKNEYKNHIFECINSMKKNGDSDEVYINEPVTLYSPGEEYKYYFVRHNGSQYHIVWTTNEFLKKAYNANGLSPSQIYLRGAYIKTSNDKTSFEEDVTYLSLTVDSQETAYRISTGFNTVEECIEEIRKPDVKFTAGTAGSYWTSNTISETSITPCSNMICFNPENQIVTNKRISKNETIIPITTE